MKYKLTFLKTCLNNKIIRFAIPSHCMLGCIACCAAHGSYDTWRRSSSWTRLRPEPSNLNGVAGSSPTSVRSFFFLIYFVSPQWPGVYSIKWGVCSTTSFFWRGSKGVGPSGPGSTEGVLNFHPIPQEKCKVFSPGGPGLNHIPSTDSYTHPDTGSRPLLATIIVNG